MKNFLVKPYVASLGSMKNQAMLVTNRDPLVQRSYLVDSERDSNVLLIKEQEFLCVD